MNYINFTHVSPQSTGFLNPSSLEPTDQATLLKSKETPCSDSSSRSFWDARGVSLISGSPIPPDRLYERWSENGTDIQRTSGIFNASLEQTDRNSHKPPNDGSLLNHSFSWPLTPAPVLDPQWVSPVHGNSVASSDFSNPAASSSAPLWTPNKSVMAPLQPEKESERDLWLLDPSYDHIEIQKEETASLRNRTVDSNSVGIAPQFSSAALEQSSAPVQSGAPRDPSHFVNVDFPSLPFEGEGAPGQSESNIDDLSSSSYDISRNATSKQVTNESEQFSQILHSEHNLNANQPADHTAQINASLGIHQTTPAGARINNQPARAKRDQHTSKEHTQPYPDNPVRRWHIAANLRGRPCLEKEYEKFSRHLSKGENQQRNKNASEIVKKHGWHLPTDNSDIVNTAAQYQWEFPRDRLQIITRATILSRNQRDVTVQKERKNTQFDHANNSFGHSSASSHFPDPPSSSTLSISAPLSNPGESLMTRSQTQKESRAASAVVDPAYDHVEIEMQPPPSLGDSTVDGNAVGIAPQFSSVALEQSRVPVQSGAAEDSSHFVTVHFPSLTHSTAIAASSAELGSLDSTPQSGNFNGHLQIDGLSYPYARLANTSVLGADHSVMSSQQNASPLHGLRLQEPVPKTPFHFPSLSFTEQEAPDPSESNIDAPSSSSYGISSNTTSHRVADESRLFAGILHPEDNLNANQQPDHTAQPNASLGCDQTSAAGARGDNQPVRAKRDQRISREHTQPYPDNPVQLWAKSADLPGRPSLDKEYKRFSGRLSKAYNRDRNQEAWDIVKQHGWDLPADNSEIVTTAAQYQWKLPEDKIEIISRAAVLCRSVRDSTLKKQQKNPQFEHADKSSSSLPTAPLAAPSCSSAPVANQGGDIRANLDIDPQDSELLSQQKTLFHVAHNSEGGREERHSLQDPILDSIEQDGVHHPSDLDISSSSSSSSASTISEKRGTKIAYEKYPDIAARFSDSSNRAKNAQAYQTAVTQGWKNLPEDIAVRAKMHQKKEAHKIASQKYYNKRKGSVKK